MTREPFAIEPGTEPYYDRVTLLDAIQIAREARSCGALPGASLSAGNPRFAGVFDSYRAHPGWLEQAKTRIPPRVRRVRDARDERAVPPRVPPGICPC